MTHYTYKIINDITGEYYYGKRSCSQDDPADDPYMGSGYLIQHKMRLHPEYNWKKEIVGIYETAEAAYKAEEELIGDLWSADEKCLNLCPGGSGGHLTIAHLELRLKKLEALNSEYPIEVSTVCLHNNDEGVWVEISTKTSTGIERIKKLVSEGWEIGINGGYKKVGLAEIGADAEINSREFLRETVYSDRPFKVKGFGMSHDGLKRRVLIDATSGDLAKGYAKALSELGWVFGSNYSYEKVSLTEVGLVSFFRDYDEEYRKYKEGVELKNYKLVNHSLKKKITVYTANVVEELLKDDWVFGYEGSYELITQVDVGVARAKVSPEELLRRHGNSEPMLVSTVYLVNRNNNLYTKISINKKSHGYITKLLNAGWEFASVKGQRKINLSEALNT